MSILAIIPARGGSKEIPKKNIKMLGDKPLIGWTIKEALKTKSINKLIVSTDCKEIANISRSFGAEIPFLRPSNLAQDNTPGVDTVLHAIDNLSYFEWVLLLQPTSPFRNKSDIEGIINFAKKKNINSVVSVNKYSFNPFIVFEKNIEHKLKPLIDTENKISNRQNLNIYYKVNGALYLCKSKWLLKYKNLITLETYGYEMPLSRSLDIDTYQDWDEANHKIGNYSNY